MSYCDVVVILDLERAPSADAPATCPTAHSPEEEERENSTHILSHIQLYTEKETTH